MVGRKTAQVGGANQASSVTDGLGVDVVGGYNVAQKGVQIGVALIDEVFSGNDVDRDGGVCGGTALDSRTNGDYLFDNFTFFRDNGRRCSGNSDSQK
ncbi:hypothetical protein GCM10008940_05870 [Microbulbifer agarilyticus]